MCDRQPLHIPGTCPPNKPLWQPLRDAVDWVEENHPLPRCQHGHALRDHGGEALYPPCGCRKNPERAS